MRAALDITTWHLPALADVIASLSAARQRARARRRRRIGLIGVAVGTLAAVLLTVSAVHRPDVEPRKPGVWAFSHTVRPLPGWSIQSRTVERQWETTTLRAEPPRDRPVLSGGRRLRCHLGSTAAAARRQRFGSAPARRFYAERVWPNGGGAMLWWEYADTAWVIIECGGSTTPREMLPKLAGHVALSAESVLLPYRVRSIPPHYEVTSVTKGLVSNSTVAYLTRNDYPEGIMQISIRYPAGLPMYGVNNSASVLRYANGRHAAVCRPFGDSHVCVRGDLSSPGSIDIAAQPGALAVIDRIASNLELAASPTDLASWFDAREALPS